MSQLRWVVAGGGTGGHVTPALALAERIRARGDALLLLGSERGLETQMVPEAGFELVALPAQPVYGQSLLRRLASLPAMARACFAAWRELGRFGADVVVSVGGYASVPAVVAAVLRRIPIALVEPNAIPGRANRAAARFATRIYVQFDAAEQAFAAAGAGTRVRALGIPLREKLVEAFPKRAERRVPTAPLRLFVFGGSQGARQINDALIEAAPGLDASQFEIHHQTGEADRERVEAAYREAGLRATVVAFERDMPECYRWADLALCRSGALTIAELTLSGLPALLVPYPFAADDHQAANADALVASGAARVLAGRDLDGSQVAEALRDFASAPDQLVPMAKRAAQLAHPGAAERIVDDCAAQVGE
jgi:UDP-N-acetylglucosamine--N-acetylmuramyl-(pentapeptide) pyrophosphoryl-undecaprenol N-acetylglucosamine transferase